MTAKLTDSDYDKIFVGREKELTDFETFIRSVHGQVLIVVGAKGMGKTYLLERYQYEAMNEYECFTIFHKFYASTEPKDHVKVLLNDIYDRTGILFKHGNFIQNAVKFIPWVGQSLSEALGAPTGSDTYKFTLFLGRVSDHIDGEDQRLLVLVDPRDEMERDEHRDTFRQIIDTIKETPRIKLVIAQRPHDVIVTCKEIMDQDHVHSFDIDKFREEEIKECVERRLPGISKADEIAREIYRRTSGVPLECNRILSAIEFNPDYRSAEGLKRLPESTEGMDDLIIMSLTPPERSALLYMSILKISADLEFLSHYFDFEFPEMERILDDGRIAPLLRVERAETTPRYYIYHDEFQKFLLEKLRQDETLKISNLQKRAAESFYRRIEKNRNDAEALTEYTYHLKESGDRRAFIEGLDTVKYDKERIGLYQQLRGELTEALTYEEINEDLKRKGWFLNALGLVELTLGEPQAALKAHYEAADIFKGLKHRQGTMAQLGNIAVTYRTLGKLNEALTVLQDLAELRKRPEEDKNLAKDYTNIGIVLAGKGDLKGALQNHRNALEIDKRIGNRAGMAADYGNIGNVVADQGDFEGALENHRNALDINKRIGNPSGIASDYGNIGIVLYQKGDLEGALENCNKAVEVFEKTGQRGESAHAYVNIANIYFQKDDYKSAALLELQALLIYSQIGMKPDVEKAQGNLGISIRKLKEQDEFEEFLQEAKEKFGEGVEKLLRGSFTADEAD